MSALDDLPQEARDMVREQQEADQARLAATQQEGVVRSARACWEVSAGLIPGQPNPALTRRYWLLSGDPLERMAELQAEAYAAAATMTDPRVMNWVRVDWIWF